MGVRFAIGATSRAGLVLLLAGLAVAACGGAQAATKPEAAVIEFAQALDARDYDRAYGLMSHDYQRRVSLEQFRQLVEQNPDEAMRTSHALPQVHGAAEEHAVVHYGDSEELRLVREDERWVVDTDVTNYYDQSTPRAALETFVRAMERQRYDVVIRLVPNADREGITLERMTEAWSGDGREPIERMLSNLRASLNNPIEVVGDHATMAYGERLRVQFVREDDIWKIEDPE
jgi:hypothetical protein